MITDNHIDTDNDNDNDNDNENDNDHDNDNDNDNDNDYDNDNDNDNDNDIDIDDDNDDDNDNDNDNDNDHDNDNDDADDADDDDNRRSIGILLNHHRPPQEPAPSCHGKLRLGTMPLVLGVALEYVHTRHGGRAPMRRLHRSTHCRAWPRLVSEQC